MIRFIYLLKILNLNFFFCNAGDISKAELLADLIMRLGLSIEEETTAALIAVYGRQHKLKEAKRLYLAAAGESKTQGKSVINSMIDAYVRCGWLEAAYGLFMESAEKGCDPSPVTISILVNALTNQGISNYLQDFTYNKHFCIPITKVLKCFVRKLYYPNCRETQRSRRSIADLP